MSENTEGKSRPSAAEIKEWKKKHGELYQFEVEGKIVILREPTLTDLERATSADPKKKKPFNFHRSILANCKMYEDDGFSNDEKALMALFQEMDSVIEIKEATVKKL